MILPSEAVVKDPILCQLVRVSVTVHPDIGPSSMIPRAETGICSRGTSFPGDGVHPPHPPPQEVLRALASKIDATLFIKTNKYICGYPMKHISNSQFIYT